MAAQIADNASNGGERLEPDDRLRRAERDHAPRAFRERRCRHRPTAVRWLRGRRAPHRRSRLQQWHRGRRRRQCPGRTRSRRHGRAPAGRHRSRCPAVIPSGAYVSRIPPRARTARPPFKSTTPISCIDDTRCARRHCGQSRRGTAGVPGTPRRGARGACGCSLHEPPPDHPGRGTVCRCRGTGGRSRADTARTTPHIGWRCSQWISTRICWSRDCGRLGSCRTPQGLPPSSIKRRLPVLAPSRWLRDADPLPHSWDVTSDSIAAWVAGEVGARRLVLVKPPGAGDQAVDPYFHRALPPEMASPHVVAADQIDALRRSLTV